LAQAKPICTSVGTNGAFAENGDDEAGAMIAPMQTTRPAGALGIHDKG
jgi:hypothetical protein